MPSKIKLIILSLITLHTPKLLVSLIQVIHHFLLHKLSSTKDQFSLDISVRALTYKRSFLLFRHGWQLVYHQTGEMTGHTVYPDVDWVSALPVVGIGCYAYIVRALLLDQIILIGDTLHIFKTLQTVQTEFWSNERITNILIDFDIVQMLENNLLNDGHVMKPRTSKFCMPSATVCTF